MFIGVLDGTIRAYHADTGERLLLWDSVREYEGVNGLSGKGGTFGNGGPVISGRYLYINSGFNMLNVGIPGNVLLSLEIPEK